MRREGTMGGAWPVDQPSGGTGYGSGLFQACSLQVGKTPQYSRGTGQGRVRAWKTGRQMGYKITYKQCPLVLHEGFWDVTGSSLLFTFTPMGF